MNINSKNFFVFFKNLLEIERLTHNTKYSEMDLTRATIYLNTRLKR